MTDLKKRGLDNDELSDSDTDSSSQSVHGNEKRGRTVLAEVRKAIENGVKIPLDWNAAKLPCGQHRITFATYMGVVARERVNINYARWKDLPAELLDEVYNEIERGFTVLPNRRRWILSRVCVLWRSFKSRLARSYMYTVWKDKKKATIKEKSEKNSASGKARTNKYRGGRLGYQHYHEEITKEFEARGIHVEKVPRHLVWLKAHKNKVDGSYAPGDLEIAEAIQTLDAQAQEGEIVAEGRDDILAKALKKPEHGGRVRGVGAGISNREYFGPSESSDPQMQIEVKTLRSELAQLASKQNLMMEFLMKWSQQSTNQASPFTPDHRRPKTSRFMAGTSGQSSGNDGEVGGHGVQSECVRLFGETRPSETGYQHITASKSLVPSEPEAHHHFEPDMGYVPEQQNAETGHFSDPVAPIDCNQGDCSPIDCHQASPELFLKTPPTYSGADIAKVRDLWIKYVFQPKQRNEGQELVD